MGEKLQTRKSKAQIKVQRPESAGMNTPVARPSITAPLGFGNATPKSSLCARSSMDRAIGFYPVGWGSSPPGRAWAAWLRGASRR